MKQSKFMTLQSSLIPRGCYREIRKYQSCAAEKSGAACMNEKLGIMEVCPDHILEALREKRKWYLRAEAIDNETYKRAMTVSSYNKSRSVSDLTIKDWTAGHPKNLRPDSTWFDDRYDPKKFSHPHRKDSVNFPDMEYKDVFGGTMGDAEREEKEKHTIGLFSGMSTAMYEHQANKAKESIQTKST